MDSGINEQAPNDDTEEYKKQFIMNPLSSADVQESNNDHCGD